MPTHGFGLEIKHRDNWREISKEYWRVFTAQSSGGRILSFSLIRNLHCAIWN